MKPIKKFISKHFPVTDYSGLSVTKRGRQFDWEFLLATFFLLVVLVVIYSVYVFLGVRAGNLFQDGFQPPSHNDKINVAELDRILKLYSSRESTLRALQEKKPTFVDPSL